MLQRLRFFLPCLLVAGLLAPALPAAAKTLCGAIDPPSPYPFYVISKVKTKRGSYGGVSGYLIAEDSSNSAPFSGHYAAYTDQYVNLSAEWGTSQVFFGYVTYLFNFGAPNEGSSSSQGYLTIVDGFDGTVSDGGVFETTWVDCKSVPKFPVLDP
jgi:hypothetical protein